MCNMHSLFSVVYTYTIILHYTYIYIYAYETCLDGYMIMIAKMKSVAMFLSV